MAKKSRQPFHLLTTIGLLLLVAIMFAGCGGNSAPANIVSTTPTPAPSPTTASGSKTPIQGLVTMGSLGFNHEGGIPTNNMEELNAHPAVYSAAVVNVLWSQLEPQQGVFDDSALNSGLANIAAYNAKYPATPVVAKLRINAGIGTPAWVMQLTGGPITVAAASGTMQIGAFWSSPYKQAWQALQAHLAGEFDGTTSIAEVAVTSCSSRTDEPFITSLDPTSVAAMRQFGYNDTVAKACLSNAADDYAAWKQTPLDYAFNTFRDTDSGAQVEDPAFTTQVMDAFRAALGTRGVVANHGLQAPLSDAANPIYIEFQNLYNEAVAANPPSASPLEFQTYSQSVDWPSTIQLGLTYHPTEIEIWDTTAAGGYANLSLGELQGWAASLKQ